MRVPYPIAALGPVEPGSVVLIDSDVLAPEFRFSDRINEQGEWYAELRSSIAGVVGHDLFLLVAVPFDAAGEPPVRLLDVDDLQGALDDLRRRRDGR
jgi:hypothetical protein